MLFNYDSSKNLYSQLKTLDLDYDENYILDNGNASLSIMDYDDDWIEISINIRKESNDKISDNRINYTINSKDQISELECFLTEKEKNGNGFQSQNITTSEEIYNNFKDQNEQYKNSLLLLEKGDPCFLHCEKIKNVDKVNHGEAHKIIFNRFFQNIPKEYKKEDNEKIDDDKQIENISQKIGVKYLSSHSV